MSPNDVKELLDASIADLGLPLVASNSGPQLVVNRPPWDQLKKSRVHKVLEQWMNGCGKSYSISVGQSASNVEKGITRLALETYRVPEIREILKSLVTEQSLPFTVIDKGFKLEVLANEEMAYHSNDMVELEALLEKEGLDVSVRHDGFNLRQREDGAEVPFPEFEVLVNRLVSALEGYGLQVKLLHKGFQLQKDAADEVDIAEAKELTYRLRIMVGIGYAQGSYTYSNDVENPKIHWTSADVNTGV